MKSIDFRCNVILLVASLALMSSGCASQKRASSGASRTSVVAEPQVSRFGTIAFAEETGPASFGFQKAKGKLGTVKEAVWDSAALGLSGPGAGVIVTGCVLTDEFGCGNSGADPFFVAAVAGVAGGATAIGAALAGPYVGLEGLIRSLKSVSPAELLEREAALTNALNQMAAQHSFRDVLQQVGAERICGGFLPKGHMGPSQRVATAAADAILEVRVEDLRLERAGSSEASYFLHIKTHARLLRVTDSTICYDQHAEYRSGTALFLDWTLQGAIQGVAETGYKALASYYVDQLLAKSETKSLGSVSPRRPVI